VQNYHVRAPPALSGCPVFRTGGRAELSRARTSSSVWMPSVPDRRSCRTITCTHLQLFLDAQYSGQAVVQNYHVHAPPALSGCPVFRTGGQAEPSHARTSSSFWMLRISDRRAAASLELPPLAWWATVAGSCCIARRMRSTAASFSSISSACVHMPNSTPLPTRTAHATPWGGRASPPAPCAPWPHLSAPLKGLHPHAGACSMHLCAPCLPFGEGVAYAATSLQAPQHVHPSSTCTHTMHE